MLNITSDPRIGDDAVNDQGYPVQEPATPDHIAYIAANTNVLANSVRRLLVELRHTHATAFDRPQEAIARWSSYMP
ncbi:MAG: hypothetical protein JXA67_13595 [Micromonosporaceae bacterium]|nr:hypothetical protein [Micromonosporaceae bacterium]